MRERGITNIDLQNRIRKTGNNLDRTTIGNILLDKHSPRVETLQLIADALEIDLRQIFTVPDEELAGFIEYKGQVYKVGSLSELEELIYKFKTTG